MLHMAYQIMCTKATGNSSKAKELNMDKETIQKLPKWQSGQDTAGTRIDISMPLVLDVIKSDIKKDGEVTGTKTYEQLAQLGSRFGGVEIGIDHEGRRIMANISIYRKPVGVAQASRNTPISIG